MSYNGASAVLGEGTVTLGVEDLPQTCPSCREARPLYGVVVSAHEKPDGSLAPEEPAALLGAVCVRCYQQQQRERLSFPHGKTNVENRIVGPCGERRTVASPRCDRCGEALDLSGEFYAGPRCPACVRAVADADAAREEFSAFKAEVRAALAAGEESAAALVQKLTAANAPSPAQEKPMEPKPRHPIVQTLQADATDAAWRTAGAQLVKLTRDPLAAVLCRHLGPDDPAFRARVAAFLQTEIGAAMVSAVLSAGLTALPVAPAMRDRMARELRVAAMANVGDVLADLLTGPLREVAALYLQGGVVPQEPEAPLGLDVPPPPAYVVDASAVEARRQ